MVTLTFYRNIVVMVTLTFYRNVIVMVTLTFYRQIVVMVTLTFYRNTTVMATVWHLPALSRMTWSSSGSSVKWGIRFAHSTNVNSCLSAAWQILVTASFCNTVNEHSVNNENTANQLTHAINTANQLTHVCNQLIHSLFADWQILVTAFFCNTFNK